MGWKQIASSKEAYELPKGTIIKGIFGGKEYLGRVVRDGPQAGLVFFLPDRKAAQKDYSGWTHPEGLYIKV